MTDDAARALLWLGVVFAIIVVIWRAGRRPHKGGGRRTHRPGAGAYGAVYDLLNEDKRKAIEIIVEQRAEARDPEDAEGDLPNLSGGAKKSIPRVR
jgi:hypothetical protein